MRDMLHELLNAIIAQSACIESQCELIRSSSQWATKEDLNKLERNIMSAISEFAGRQNAFNARLDVAVVGLEGDVKVLNDKIEKLQNTPGVITPEDQALLDDIEKRSDAIATKLEVLDALTPPAVPVDEPPPVEPVLVEGVADNMRTNKVFPSR